MTLTSKGTRLRSATEVGAKTMLWLSGVIVVGVLGALLVHVIQRGLPFITWEFLSEAPRRMGRLGGIFPTIVGTLYLTVVALAIAAPFGVGAAIYLTEYAKRGRLTNILRFGVESLAGVPSIIFGLFGFVAFVIFLGFGWSILSGGLTLALMILPTIIRTSEEAIKTVPRSYREGSLALGATQWQTIRKVVLPSALPGILTGLILGLGRAVGETAAVMLTAGSSLGMPVSIMDPVRTMSIHLYVLAVEGLSLEKAYATATVLIFVILLINLVATRTIRLLAPRGGKA